LTGGREVIEPARIRGHPPFRCGPRMTPVPLAGRLGEDAVMEVVSSRILLRPSDLARSQAFYGEVLGLAVYREFGPTERPGVVFFLGNGLLEVSGQSEEPPVGLALWVQVRKVASEHDRLATAGVTITQPPRREPWGLGRV